MNHFTAGIFLGNSIFSLAALMTTNSANLTVAQRLGKDYLAASSASISVIQQMFNSGFNTSAGLFLKDLTENKVKLFYGFFCLLIAISLILAFLGWCLNDRIKFKGDKPPIKLDFLKKSIGSIG